jgi:hypothetical protein
MARDGFKLKDAVVFHIGDDRRAFTKPLGVEGQILTMEVDLPYENMVITTGSEAFWFAQVSRDETGGELLYAELLIKEQLRHLGRKNAAEGFKTHPCIALDYVRGLDIRATSWVHPNLHGQDMEVKPGDEAYVGPTILVALLKVLSCKNIRTQVITPKKRKLKRGKLPLLSYHILQIEQKTVNQGAQGVAMTAWSNRVHLCRGHVKEYTAERPLFGKYVGRVWCPPHARGNKALGVIHKEYKI